MRFLLFSLCLLVSFLPSGFLICKKSKPKKMVKSKTKVMRDTVENPMDEFSVYDIIGDDNL